jgi:hypothetical protein
VLVRTRCVVRVLVIGEKDVKKAEMLGGFMKRDTITSAVRTFTSAICLVIFDCLAGVVGGWFYN